MSTNPRKRMKLESGSFVTLEDYDNGSQDGPDSSSDVTRRKGNRDSGKEENTQLLDMNDDCLYSILLNVSAMDLCSLGQTCARLNAISKQLFKAKYKICNFNQTSAKTTVEAIQFFRFFGNLIVDLQIDMSSYDNAVMDAVIQYCTTVKALKLYAYKVPDNQNKIAEMGKLFQNLERLRIQLVFIDDGLDEGSDDIFTPEGNLIDCFNNCQSLVNLEFRECFNLNRVICESSFPNLHHFKTIDYNLYDGGDKRIEGFVLRHQNLKSFSLDGDDGYDGHIPALNAVAANCKNLEKLEFGFESFPDPDDYGLFLKNLSKLRGLREIKNFCTVDLATTLVKELQNHRNLEVLDLLHVQSTVELIPAVSQLEKLRFLRLNCCGGVLNDINPLGQLTELTALSIECLWLNPLLKFDLVKLVDRLVNLTRLKFNEYSFKIENRIYLQLVHTVEKRRNLQNRTLQLDCPTSNDFIDLKVAAVKFIKFE